MSLAFKCEKKPTKPVTQVKLIIYFIRSTLSKKTANIIVSLSQLKWLELIGIQARKIKGFELAGSKLTGVPL